MSSRRFALIGAAGYIAPRHMSAIAGVDGELAAAFDPHDSVGVLDRYFPQSRFFTEVERFDRYLEKLRHSADETPVDFVSICSPNYLHDAHVRLALRVKADAICEKPLVLNPWNLDQLAELEQEHSRRVYTVVQLRHHPKIRELHAKLGSKCEDTKHEVELTYITRRGNWYEHSWKGDVSKSGGLAMNIGVHFFDLLIWLFGDVERSVVYLSQSTRCSGFLELERANIRWFLSIDESDLPDEVKSGGGYAHRSLTVDDEHLDLSENFSDLHTEAYREILAGRGFGVEDTRSSIELLHQIRHSELTSVDQLAHPLLRS